MDTLDDERVYREYIEASPVGIFVVNSEGQYVDVNSTACEMVGYSKDELLSMSVTDLGVTDQEVPEEEETLAELRESGNVRTEATLRHRDGHGVDVIFDAVALDDDRFVAYCQDISTRKEFERRLKEQRDNLDVLNQMLRHDIRNDLQLVTAYAELADEACDDEGTHEYIETILQNAHHAVDLTITARNMADLMLRSEDEIQSLSLRSALETEIDEVRSSHPHAVITVESVIPNVRVRANDMLDSVFRNLLKNAVQHNTRDVPEVTIDVTESERTVTVRVADNGPGIPDEQKETIFGKGEAGLDSQGTGIGLYLVQTLVESYGGEVHVEDNDPDGAVFTVELPIAT
ncbi:MULTISPECIES: two-component system sensor histidine kinase NtrB [Salinibaculum]|uniref:two-component system sensor histidine kinase NtrB n=1 Tax=Salinibaculum TaxID=2732368 RepID=UPI0030D04BAD